MCTATSTLTAMFSVPLVARRRNELWDTVRFSMRTQRDPADDNERVIGVPSPSLSSSPVGDNTRSSVRHWPEACTRVSRTRAHSWCLICRSGRA